MKTLFKITVACFLLLGLQASALAQEQEVSQEAEAPAANGEQEEQKAETKAKDGKDGGKGFDGEDGQEGENGPDGENGEQSEPSEEQPAQDGESGESGQPVQETPVATEPSEPEGEAVGETEEAPFCTEEGKQFSKGEKGFSKDEEGEYCKQEPVAGDLEGKNSNEADVSNRAEVEADTGGNEASGNSGGGTITTGKATATLDIFNLINTSVIESEGLFVFLSNLQEQFADYDIRAWASYFENHGIECENECHTFGDLEIANENQAKIVNDVLVRAETGKNEASGNGGSGTITTGDAAAAANLVNIANTNMVNSNYLLLIANNFGDFFGDIVFPNASSFFTSLLSSPSKIYGGEVDIENNNTASISNALDVGAETGKNEADGNGTSLIQTGNASALANVFNQANTNLVGGSSFVALVRVSGDWTGDVFNLPEGIVWQQTPQGIMLYSEDLSIAKEPEENTSKFSKDSAKGRRQNGSSELKAGNTNDANITNNVQVFALTGENKANGNGEGASIQTGKAFAVANVVNIANTNVIGKNWLFALFNILGNFEGNISFGRPDLWIGLRAELWQDPARPGDEIIYYLDVANNGDAPAHNVQITNMLDTSLLSFVDGDELADFQDNQILWQLGTLRPGDAREVSFTAGVKPDIPYGRYDIINTSSVGAVENDEDERDNTDEITLAVVHQEPSPPSNGGGGFGHPMGPFTPVGYEGDLETSSTEETQESGAGVRGESASATQGAAAPEGDTGSTAADSGKKPNLRVVKNYTRAEHVYPGDSVDYTVVISNMSGGSAFDAVLIDTLVNGNNGNVVHEETWELGEVFPDEEITITYTTIFDKEAKPGLYTNKARVEARNGVSDIAGATILLEDIKAEVVKVTPLEPIVLDLQEQDVFPSKEEADTELADEENTGQVEEIAYVPEVQEAVAAQPEKAFLASLAGFAQEYGTWLGVAAAAALLLLFLLFRKALARTM